LAENADFAEICESCNIKFIGPTSTVIRLMGDKIKAKEAMKKDTLPAERFNKAIELIKSDASKKIAVVNSLSKFALTSEQEAELASC